MASDNDNRFQPRQSSTPRTLLRQLREIMAEETGAQIRLDRFTRAIAQNMVADVCSIYLRRRDDQLELFATQGLKAEAVHTTRLALGEGLVGWVARNRRFIRLREATTHEDFSYRPETGEDPYNAFLGVPIVRSGQVLGVLVVQNMARRVFTDDEVDAAQTIAMILAEIVATGELLDETDAAEVEGLLIQEAFAQGQGVVPGVVQGTVYLLEPEAASHATFADDVAAEQRRLTDAIADMRKSVDTMIAADDGLGESSREVLEVFRLFAYDRGWARKLEEKVLAGLTAESAVEQTRDENRTRMRAVKDQYLRERMHDLEDLSRRLLRALSKDDGGFELPEDAVVLADTMGPVELLELKTTSLAGMVLSEAAGVSHVAIVARSLGIPMVSGVEEIVQKASSGDTIVLDGTTGEVHLRPTPGVISAFESRRAVRTKALARYAANRDEPAVTTDGVPIALQMNAGLLIDMPNLDESGAVGVGLFRTELQFLLGQSLPTAKEQEELYAQILDAAGSRPVIFRTADIGSDKRAGYMEPIHEGNPAMGWRGLRVAMDRAGLMRTQIRALLSAAKGRPLSFMLPLVTTTDEFRAARSIIYKEFIRHEKHVGTLPPSIEIGAMVEIPSAAWDARRLAAEADFLSIGGNDLAQFFFAADRDTDKVADRYDPLSPSFLSFLGRTITEAKAAKKPIGYCGEQAGDPAMALALLGLGIDRLSVAAGSVGPLKAMIRSASYGKLRAAVMEMIERPVPTIRPLLSAFAIENGIEFGP